jgi:hypothetical protein
MTERHAVMKKKHAAKQEHIISTGKIQPKPQPHMCHGPGQSP